MIKCIIAEKPSVARDIARVLGVTNSSDGYIAGNGYIVTWAFGHLLTLALPQAYDTPFTAENLPFVPKNFKLSVRTSKGKEDPAVRKQLNTIKQCFDKADSIIVATDAGREGELIFRYIYYYLGCKKPFERLWISSLTDKAIKDGFNNLKAGNGYDRLFLAGQARSEADWIVGLNASQALSISSKKTSSLGRVQTPTLALICRRYIENTTFKSSFYHKVNATLNHSSNIYKVQGSNKYDDRQQVESVYNDLCQSKHLEITEVVRKEISINPPLLFDLTELQKEANKRFGYSADKTLSIMQSLYENKMVTYPRTGSRYISEDIYEQIPSLIDKLRANPQYTSLFSLSCLNRSELSRTSVDNNKITDHHAIIPTGEMNRWSKDEYKKNLEQNIYNLVVERFVESFSKPSVKDTLRVAFVPEDKNIDECFTLSLFSTISLGWKEVCLNNNTTNDEEEQSLSEQECKVLPLFNKGEYITPSDYFITDHKTKPKPLYTEATLLAVMENASREISDDKDAKKAMSECGLGTPATRAGIIEKLLRQGYITRDKKKLLPTSWGLEIYNIVKDKAIADVKTTGLWELSLASIEKGLTDKKEFKERIIEYTRKICYQLLTTSVEEHLLKCPICGKSTFKNYNKVVKCTSESCQYTLFKNVFNKDISDKNIKELSEKGKTSLIKGFKSKAGKTFNAYLFLNKETRKIELEFEKQKKG